MDDDDFKSPMLKKHPLQPKKESKDYIYSPTQQESFLKKTTSNQSVLGYGN